MTVHRPRVAVERPPHLPPLLFDRASIQAVDRAATDEYHVPGIVLMENAARGLAGHVMRLVEPGAVVLICCGAGNNGGDGYALARHLHNARARPVLAPLAPPRAGSDAAINERICGAIGIPRVSVAQRDSVNARLLVDAVFGTGLDRPVSGPPADWIAWMNRQSSERLAVDVPSGLDCDTGRALGDALRAHHTVTFVGLKVGFLAAEAQDYLGAIAIVDIGAPLELYLRHGRPLDSTSGPNASTDLS